VSFTRDVSLFFPAKQFTTDQEEHLRNLVTLERWSESGHDFLYLLNKDALPDEADFGLGTLLVENEILKIRKTAGWKTLVDEDSLVGLLPANIAYIDVANVFTERQTIENADGTLAALQLKNTTPTPAADTRLGRLDFLGLDDTGAPTSYAGVEGYVLDDTHPSEDGYGLLKAGIAGAYQEIVRWGGVGPASEKGVLLGGDILLYRGNANELWLDDLLRIRRASVLDYSFITHSTAEGGARLAITANGNLEWGNGAGPVDAYLYRGAAGELWSDNRWRFRRTNAADIILSAQRVAHSDPAFTLAADGKLEWGPGGGVGTPTDVDLYRHAANFLRTSDGFMADGGLYVWRTGQALEFKRLADTQPRFTVDDSGSHAWGAGGVTAVDTNLYRSAADRLKTDDQLHAVDGLVTKTKAGVLADGDFTAGALDGLLGVDTTAGKLMFRSGGAWKTLDPAAGGSDPYTEITKGADQDVTNNAVRQNDTALTFAVANGDLLHVEFAIIYSGNNTTGDYKYAFTLPANCIAMGELMEWSTADAFVTPGGLATAIGGGALWPAAERSIGTDAAHTTRLLQGYFKVLCKAAGNIVFTFANAAAAAGRTSRTHAGSTIRYRKLN
jgi:hypothetical protein